MTDDALAEPGDPAEEVIIHVTYPGNASNRFDRDYYVEQHMPKLVDAWGPHGMTSIEAFFPVTSTPSPTLAICECRFRDEAALAAAMSCDAMQMLGEDIVNYTDVMPLQLRAAQ